MQPAEIAFTLYFHQFTWNYVQILSNGVLTKYLLNFILWGSQYNFSIPYSSLSVHIILNWWIKIKKKLSCIYFSCKKFFKILLTDITPIYILVINPRNAEKNIYMHFFYEITLSLNLFDHILTLINLFLHKTYRYIILHSCAVFYFMDLFLNIKFVSKLCKTRKKWDYMFNTKSLNPSSIFTCN
jgi:hypothetical protein